MSEARQLHIPPELVPADQRVRREELDSALRWADLTIEEVARDIGRGAERGPRLDELTPVLLLAEWLRRR